MRINRAFSIVLVALMVVAMLPTFTFAAGTGTVTISGNSNFVSAPVGTYSKLTYTADYNSGEVTNPKAFSWKVTEDGVAASDAWCVDGEFIVSGGAEGTYKITAIHNASGIKSADFPVTVTASTLYDWSDNIPLGYEKKTLATEVNGNKYYDNYFKIDTEDYHLSSGSDAGVKTLNLRFKVPVEKRPAKDKEHYNIVCDYSSSYKGPITAYRYDEKVGGSDGFMLTVRGKYWDSLCDVSGNNKLLDYDTWYELCVVFDIPAETNIVPNVTGLWLNGEYCKTRQGSTGDPADVADIYDSIVDGLRFYQHCDDVVMYSGEPYTGVIPSSEYTVNGEAFDIDEGNLENGQTLSFTFSANQIQEAAETYMVVAAKYTPDGKELLIADVKDLTTEKGVKKSITVSAEKSEDSMIKMFVLKKVDIFPVIYKLVK